MSTVRTGTSSTLFGDKGHISVGRGVAEFNCRRPVLVTAQNERLLALPVDGLDDARLAEFTALCAPSEPYLVISSRRALALGINTGTSMAVRLSSAHDAESILAFVGDSTSEGVPSAVPAGRAAAAAIQLAKLSHGLPAVLAADLQTYRTAGIRNVTTFAAWIDAAYAEAFGEPLLIQEYGEELRR